MNVVIQTRNKSTDESITFPALQCWNPVTEVATIAAEYSGRRISCRIGIKDLSRKYEVDKDEPMQSITNYRKELEIVARKLIGEKKYEEDGSIMINYDDL
jgi:hypothetical protein